MKWILLFTAFVLWGCFMDPNPDEIEKEKCQEGAVVTPKLPDWKNACETFRREYDKELWRMNLRWDRECYRTEADYGWDVPSLCPKQAGRSAMIRMYQIMDDVFCGDMPDDHYGERERR